CPHFHHDQIRLPRRESHWAIKVSIREFWGHWTGSIDDARLSPKVAIVLIADEDEEARATIAIRHLRSDRPDDQIFRRREGYLARVPGVGHLVVRTSSMPRIKGNDRFRLRGREFRRRSCTPATAHCRQEQEDHTDDEDGLAHWVPPCSRRLRGRRDSFSLGD